MLGPRSRVGGAHFRLGAGSHIRAVRLPDGKSGLLVANELNDIRLYRDLDVETPLATPVLSVGRPDPGDTYPMGYSGCPSPQPRYVAARPVPDADAWHLVIGTLTGRPALAQADWIGMADDGLRLQWPRPLLAVHGIPDFVDLRRDGRLSLLLGQADGTLALVPPSDTDPSGFDLSRQYPAKPSSNPYALAPDNMHLAGGRPAPISHPGPVYPCITDWQGQGTRDLLLGTGDGLVLLFRDIGGPGEVCWDRGRPLADADGIIRMNGAACPTLMTTRQGRYLMVLDGDGVLWRWPLERHESWVTDDLFAVCGGEANGLALTARPGTWSVCTAGDRRGLCAGEVSTAEGKAPVVFGPAAPELSITPPVEGLCEIHLMLYRPPGHGFRTPLRVRMDGEPCPDIILPGESLQWPAQELYLRTVDCTARHLCLSQVMGDFATDGALPVFLSSLRFVPVASASRAACAPERPSLPIPLAGIADVADWYRQFRLDSPGEVEAFVTLQARCGFERLYFKLGGASWEFPSAVPEADDAVPDIPGHPKACTDEVREHSRRWTAIAWRVNRIGPAVDACRRQGMQILGQLRLQNQGEHIQHGFPVDRFFVNHPEFLERDAWGSVHWKHCLAYPEVAAYHVRIVEESMGFGLDGILVDTLRQLPKVLYGDPVVAEFRARHGVDMRGLPPFDDRVVELQCEIFTRFIRQIRAAIERVNPRGELHLRVCRPYPLMGVDPVALAREGLVDEILIEDRSDTPREPDIAGLVNALKGTACRAGATFCRMNQWGTEIMPLAPELVERKAWAYARAGASSVTVYESNEVPLFPELRRAFHRLRHPGAPVSRRVG